MRNQRSLLPILILFILIMGCIDPIGQPADFVDIDFFVNYINKQGESLLDPATDSAFDTADIRLYYEKDGEMIASEKYRIIDGYFQIWANLADESGITTTYIQLSKDDMDTIETGLTIQPGYKVIDAIWYNGDSSLNWFGNEQWHGRAFEVIK